MEESLGYSNLDFLADIESYACLFVGVSINISDVGLSFASNICRIIQQMKSKPKITCITPCFTITI